MHGPWFATVDPPKRGCRISRVVDPAGVEIVGEFDRRLAFLAKGSATTLWGLDFDRGAAVLVDQERAEIGAVVETGHRPNAIVATADCVFVSHQRGGSPIVAIDPLTFAVSPLPVSGHVLAASTDALWYCTYPGSDQVALLRYDRESATASEVVRSADSPVLIREGRVLCGGQAPAWYDLTDGQLVASLAISGRTNGAALLAAAAVDDTALGLALTGADEASLVRISGGRLAGVRRLDGAYRLAGGSHAVWIAWRPSKARWDEAHDECLYCIDASSLEIVRTEAVRGRVLAMA